MENIKYVQVKDPDSGALSEAYLLEVEAQNVIFEDKENLVEKMAKKSDKAIYGDNEVNLGRIEDSEKGLNSITLGTENIASGDYATATGYNTIAAGNHSHVEGRYNIEDTENRYAFIIGNGYLPEVTEEVPSPDPIRSNAFAVDWEGKVYAKTFINGDGAELYPSLKSIFVNDVEYNLNGGSLILQAGDNITLTPGVTEGTDNEDIVDGSLTVIISSTGGGSGSGGGDGEYLPLAGGKVYGPVIIERDTERVSELEDENGNFKNAFRVRDKNNPRNYLDLSHKAITTNKTLQLNKISNGYVEIGNTITFSSTGTGGTNWTKDDDAPLQALQWGNVDTQAFGYYSQAFGTNAKSYGLNSFAQGDSVKALGESSHVEGVSSEARGVASHAEGIATIATGEYSHAEGAYSQAYGEGSHAEGFNSQLYVKTEGLEDDEVKNDILNKWNQSNVDSWDDANLYQKFGLAFGKASHVQGRENLALGNYSSANGVQTVADGEAATANGKGSTAYGRCATVDGYQCVASGNGAYANGYQSSAKGQYTEAKGYRSNVRGDFSYVSGYNNFLQGNYSWLHGSNSIVKGDKCFIFGNDNKLDLENGSFIFGNNINLNLLYKYNLTNITTVQTKSLILGNNISFIRNADVKYDTVPNKTPFFIALGNNLSVEMNFNNKQGNSYASSTENDNILLGENNHIYLNYIYENDDNYPNLYGNIAMSDNIIVGKNNEINGVRGIKNFIFGFNNLASKDKFYGNNEPKDDEGFKNRMEIGFIGDNTYGSFIFGSENKIINCGGVTINGAFNKVKYSGINYIEGIYHNLKFKNFFNNPNEFNETVGSGQANHIEGFAISIQGVQFSATHIEGGLHELTYTDDYTKNEYSNYGPNYLYAHIEGYKHKMSQHNPGEESYYSNDGIALHLEGNQNKIFGKLKTCYHIEGCFNEIAEDATRTTISTSPGGNHVEGFANKIDSIYNLSEHDFYSAGLHMEGYQNIYIVNSYLNNYGIHIEGAYNKLINNIERLDNYVGLHIEGYGNQYFHQGEGTHIEGYCNITEDSLIEGSHIGGANNSIALNKFGWQHNFVYCEGYNCQFGQDKSYINTINSKRLSQEEYDNLPRIEWSNYYCDVLQSYYNSLSYSQRLYKQWYCTDTGNIYHGDNEYYGPVVENTANYIHIEGKENSHSISANGPYTSYSGTVGHIEGYRNILLGGKSGGAFHIEGKENQACTSNHIEGYNNTALGTWTHVEGQGNTSTTTSQASHVEGQGCTVTGQASHAEGQSSYASGTASHAEGQSAISYGQGSHAEGLGETSGASLTDFSLDVWLSSRNFLIAYGTGSHAEGYLTYANGTYSHTEGIMSCAKGIASHSEGNLTFANDSHSHAEGQNTIAYGVNSHAEGYGAVPYIGLTDYDISYDNWLNQKFLIAYGNYSHAEGNSTYAEGLFSHTEGFQTYAKEVGTHAEGNTTQALGQFAHAQNIQTIAGGVGSHAGGYLSKALGIYSFAHGDNVVAASHHQFIIGKYNIEDEDGEYAFILGNGGPQVDEETGETTDEIIYSNAFTIDWDGKVSATLFNGAINTHKIGNADFNGTQDITLEDIGVPSKEELDETYSKKEDTVKSIEIKDYEINYTNGIGETKSYQLPVTEMPIGTIITNDNPNSSGFEYGNWKCLGKNTMILSPLDETVTTISEVITYVWKRIED